MSFKITRSIEIDAGHRVPTHGSKCANIHGHRYKVICEVESASLNEIDHDEQQDMVLDFGFLKDIMMEKVDGLADHGMILYCKDPWLKALATEETRLLVEELMIHDGQYATQDGHRGDPCKLLVVGFIPTAERLAEFWFNVMKDAVYERSNRMAHLLRVVVWETPNCCACYPSDHPSEAVQALHDYMHPDSTVVDIGMVTRVASSHLHPHPMELVEDD